MHSFFARKFLGFDTSTVYVGLKAQTYYSSAGSILGHTCSFSPGHSLHYSTASQVVGQSIVQATKDAAHPMIQIHKNNHHAVLGYTKVVARQNVRLHFSADDQLIGVSHIDRDLGFQTHLDAYGVVLGQTRRVVMSGFTLAPAHLLNSQTFEISYVLA
jgi:hypothetical protein